MGVAIRSILQNLEGGVDTAADDGPFRTNTHLRLRLQCGPEAVRARRNSAFDETQIYVMRDRTFITVTLLINLLEIFSMKSVYARLTEAIYPGRALTTSQVLTYLRMATIPS